MRKSGRGTKGKRAGIWHAFAQMDTRFPAAPRELHPQWRGNFGEYLRDYWYNLHYTPQHGALPTSPLMWGPAAHCRAMARRASAALHPPRVIYHPCKNPSVMGASFKSGKFTPEIGFKSSSSRENAFVVSRWKNAKEGSLLTKTGQ